MHPELQIVFDYLNEFDVAICGSSVKDYDAANDIDVMVPASVSLRHLCAELGIQYRGKWQQTPTKAIRRSRHFLIPGVNKAVQLCQNSEVERFGQHPFAVLTRSGEMLNPGVFFIEAIHGVPTTRKPASTPISARDAARLHP